MTNLASSLRKVSSLLSSSRFYFSLPKKGLPLIYDSTNAGIIKELFPDIEFNIIETRNTGFFVPALVVALFKRSFWSGDFFAAYVDSFIYLIDAKIIITFIDNDIRFFSLSLRNKAIKTVLVQNGYRDEAFDFFSSLSIKTKSLYKVDYMFVFGEALSKLYSTYFQGQPVIAGSVKSNRSIARIRGSVRENEDINILFVSQYSRFSHSLISSSSKVFTCEEFYRAEMILLNSLSNYIKQSNKGISLTICGRSLARNTASALSEKKFFVGNLKDVSFSYVPRLDDFSSYKLMDEHHIVIGVDSTLLYESLSRGHITGFFCLRASLLDEHSLSFGWPDQNNSEGPFWTTIPHELNVFKTLDFLCDQASERSKYDNYANKFRDKYITYDPGNSAIKNFKPLIDQFKQGKKRIY